MEATDSADAAPQRRDRQMGAAALVVSLMAVVFALAIGPRLRGTEREQAALRSELAGLRQEVAALRRDLAQVREELQAAQQTAARPAAANPEVEVVDAKGTPVTPAADEDLRSRLALLDARHARLAERFNRLLRDLKSSNVDLGLTDEGP